MDNFDLRKYLAEGKLNENFQIDDIFGEYVAQWSQGNYDYDFADLKSGSVKGSLVDDFTLGPDEYDDDEYVRDYKIMRDYLLKNRSYKLSQDEKEGLSQFPVQFTLDDDGETIKADIYYSPEYLAMVDADLTEGKLNEEEEEFLPKKISNEEFTIVYDEDDMTEYQAYDELLSDREQELIRNSADVFIFTNKTPAGEVKDFVGAFGS